MKYYAVIDTNVIISSLLKEDSIPGKIIEYVADNVIIPFVNDEILKEYYEVATRNKFNIDENKINFTIELFKKRSIFIEQDKIDEVFVDKDDIVFYEIVMTARKTTDSYLVTGNMKHFPKKSFIITPREMYEIVESEKRN